MRIDFLCDTVIPSTNILKKFQKINGIAIQLLRLIFYKILLYLALGCVKSVLAGKYLIKVLIINSSGDRGTAMRI